MTGRDPGMFDPDVTGGAVLWALAVWIIIVIGVVVLVVTR